MLGRFLFGLGGENLSVATSVFYSTWFQGKELSFAFGISPSVASISTSINGPVVISVADKYSVGSALLVGFFICLFSLLMSFLMCWIDAWATKKDGVSVNLSNNDKFKFSDLKQLNHLPFWLLNFSFVISMVIYPYIEFSSDMLENRFGFNEVAAGSFYSLPYIILAVMSPLIGIIIDKIGKRTLFSKFPTKTFNLAILIVYL